MSPKLHTDYIESPLKLYRYKQCCGSNYIEFGSGSGLMVMLSILKRKKKKNSVKKITFFTFQKITHWIVKFFCSFTSILSYFYVGLRIRIRNKDSDSTSSWIRIQFGIQIHNNGNNAIPVPWQCCAVSTSPLPASAHLGNVVLYPPLLCQPLLGPPAPDGGLALILRLPPRTEPLPVLLPNHKQNIKDSLMSVLCRKTRLI